MPARRSVLLIPTLGLAAAFSPAAIAVDVRDYFPTPNGAIWTYQFADWTPSGRCAGERTVRVDAAVSGRLKLVTLAVATQSCPASSSNAASTEIFTIGGDGHRLTASDNIGQQAAEHSEWTPAMLVLPHHANIYQAFQSSGVVREAGDTVTVSYQATLRLLGIEKLAVPAGVFPAALHLQLIETRDVAPPLAGQVIVRTDRWLGRAIGALKIKTEVLVDGKLARSTVLQLACSSLSDINSKRCEAPEQAGGAP